MFARLGGGERERERGRGTRASGRERDRAKEREISGVEGMQTERQRGYAIMCVRASAAVPATNADTCCLSSMSGSLLFRAHSLLSFLFLTPPPHPSPPLSIKHPLTNPCARCTATYAVVLQRKCRKRSTRSWISKLACAAHSRTHARTHSLTHSHTFTGLLIITQYCQ